MNYFKVQDVFNPAEADLSGISSSESLFVSSIIHKSFIYVDQYGTEAAAATAVIIDMTAVPGGEPRVVKINQPFMFMIYDEDRNVVLFVGRMVHPNTANNAEKYLEAGYSGSFRQLNDRLRFLLGTILLAWLLIVHF
jgi:serine protease inhibitor